MNIEKIYICIYSAVRMYKENIMDYLEKDSK